MRVGRVVLGALKQDHAKRSNRIGKEGPTYRSRPAPDSDLGTVFSSWGLRLGE